MVGKNSESYLEARRWRNEASEGGLAEKTKKSSPRNKSFLE
jgi:hypothetical protein